MAANCGAQGGLSYTLASIATTRESYLSLHLIHPLHRQPRLPTAAHLHLARVGPLQAVVVGMAVTTGSHQQLLKPQHHLLALDAAPRRPCWNPWGYCLSDSVSRAWRLPGEPPMARAACRTGDSQWCSSGSWLQPLHYPCAAYRAETTAAYEHD